MKPAPCPQFPPAEKLAVIERELRMRRRVYPRLVADGRMSQRDAGVEIAVMEAIAADYRDQRQPQLDMETPHEGR